MIIISWKAFTSILLSSNSLLKAALKGPMAIQAAITPRLLELVRNH